MPKIIPELREKLLFAARKRLLEDEAHDFSTRQLAADCGVAAGTVYNYFPTKEALMAAVMLEDWQISLTRMEKAAERAESISKGFSELETLLRAFSKPYLPVWRTYNHPAPLPEYHTVLIRQLSRILDLLLQRTDKRCTETERTVLAELLLAASLRAEGTVERLIPVIEKIIA